MSVDLVFYQNIIETCFPDVRVAHISFIGGGTCRVFAVNHALIFRFPHGGGSVDDDDTLEDDGAFLYHEKRVYDCVAPLLPLPIPRYRYFSTGCAQFPYPIAGYEKLPGRSLSGYALSPQALQGAAGQIGAFLSALHAVPFDALPAQLQPSDPSIQGKANARGLFRQVEAQAFPLLSPEEQAWTSRLFQEMSDDLYPMALSHLCLRTVTSTARTSSTTNHEERSAAS